MFFGRMVERPSLSSMDRVRCIGCHPVANSEASGFANRSEESVESTAWGTLQEVRRACCRPICERGLSRDRIGSILGLADHAVV